MSKDIKKGWHYTDQHEWVEPLADGNMRIGITDYAQSELGDVVFVEMPKVGAQLGKGDSFGTVESVKAVSDIYAPISGEVVQVNDDLGSTPELVNAEPYDRAWMIVIKPDKAGQLDALMNSDQYAALLSEIAK